MEVATTRPPWRLLVTCALSAVLLLGLLWWFDPSEADVPLCRFHAMTGLDCPACGATRATHHLLHGRLLAALRCNALWVCCLPVALYVALSELRLSLGGRPLPGDLPRRRWFWPLIVTTAIAFCLARNLLAFAWAASL